MPQRIRREQPSDRRQWFARCRPHALKELSQRAVNAKWNRRLLRLLLQELDADETFAELVGDPARIPVRRYAEAVAVALLIRHSWRSDDLASYAEQLGLTIDPRRGQVLHHRSR